MAETRIVVGMLDTPFERDQEAKIITMAAGALAMVAAIGNCDASLFFQLGNAIAETDRTLSADAKAKLRLLADELVAAARLEKHFVALAGFRKENQP